MESLPTDILLELLFRVPVESVLECKLVCKRFGSLIRGSEFTKMHLTRQISNLHDGNDNIDAAKVVEPCLLICILKSDNRTLLFNGEQVSDIRISIDEKYNYNRNLKRIHHPRMHDEYLFIHLVGSCNGLVCAFQQHQKLIDPIYICNPFTREYVYLPVNEDDADPDLPGQIGDLNIYDRIACGFGYVRSTNKYKVVRIHYTNSLFVDGNVQVYTLGSGCGWRAKGKFYYRMEISGTYANDAIYWILFDKVAIFDLVNEEFRLLSVPPCMEDLWDVRACGLVALGRHLCLYINLSRDVVQVWSLTTKETWRMEFDIDHAAVVGGIFQPILLTKKGEIVLLWRKESESVLYCYDTKTTILKTISNKSSTDYIKDAIAHINTFASLEKLWEKIQRYTQLGKDNI